MTCVNHTFTSSLTANCDVLDMYFWNRFPTFKLVSKVVTDVKKQIPFYIYLRLTEKGLLKEKKVVSREFPLNKDNRKRADFDSDFSLSEEDDTESD